MIKAEARPLSLIATFTLLASVLVCFHTAPSLATPPEDIELRYVQQSQTLMVTLIHISNRPKSHYIRMVEIKKNGSTVSIESYSNQPTESRFTYAFKIPAGDDDTFQVVVTCNRGDVKSSNILTVRP